MAAGKLVDEFGEAGVVPEKKDGGAGFGQLMYGVLDLAGTGVVECVEGDHVVGRYAEGLDEESSGVEGSAGRRGEDQLRGDTFAHEEVRHERGVGTPTTVEGSVKISQMRIIPTRFGMPHQKDTFHTNNFVVRTRLRPLRLTSKGFFSIFAK